MVSREYRVSNLMLRSLCGCRMNKVDDKNAVVIRDYRDTVFIYTSSNVLCRSLLGAFFTSLENANLKVTEMLMLKPSHNVVKKSAMLRKNGRITAHANDLCVVSLWRGEDVFRHAMNAVVQFCNTYAFVRGVDIVMTDSAKTTRREGVLWIEPLTPSLLPPIASVDDEAPPVVDVPTQVVEMTAPMDVAIVAVPISPAQNENDRILVRDSSTADTLPLEDNPPLPQNTLVLLPSTST